MFTQKNKILHKTNSKVYILKEMQQQKPKITPYNTQHIKCWVTR